MATDSVRLRLCRGVDVYEDVETGLRYELNGHSQETPAPDAERLQNHPLFDFEVLSPEDTAAEDAADAAAAREAAALAEWEAGVLAEGQAEAARIRAAYGAGEPAAEPQPEPAPEPAQEPQPEPAGPTDGEIDAAHAENAARDEADKPKPQTRQRPRT